MTDPPSYTLNQNPIRFQKLKPLALPFIQIVRVKSPELAQLAVTFAVLSGRKRIVRPPPAMSKLVSLPHVTNSQAP